jgi:phosphatidate phosphatase APP1
MQNLGSRRLRVSMTIAGLCACLMGSAHADTREVVVYPGVGAGGFVLEGRVIEARGDAPEAADDSWFVNLKRTLRRLINDEQKNVALRVRLGTGGWRAVTDAEGYFRLEASLPSGSSAGWQTVEVATESGDAKTTGALLAVPAENRLGIISDVDDTILVSDVANKLGLVRKTLFVNYVQRQAVTGTAEFYTRLAQRNPRPQAAPVFYLSASLRQLQAGIQAFLDKNAFPRGVLITRKITASKTSDPLIDKVKYKVERIEQLLAALPQVRFVLVGDDGESDPETYDAIRRRHPERIEAVWIRKVNRDAARRVYPEQGDLATALVGAGKPGSQSQISHRCIDSTCGIGTISDTGAMAGALRADV